MNNRPKLTFEQVCLIRKELEKKKKSIRKIAKEQSVSSSTIFDIKINRTWRKSV